MLESREMEMTAKKQTKAKTALPKTKKKASAKEVPQEVSIDAGAPPSGQKALLVVESPAKAKTLKKYLGRNFIVQASVGHVKDLPKSKIGVDIEHDFIPEYEVIRGKGKIIADLKKAAKQVDIIYLAPDPDREGEAIAWHLAEEIKSVNPNIKRVLFNEITKRGVTNAMAHPTQLDANMYDAQQSRRILDRLVGYKISPLLWNKVQRGLSAGRVQSVAVRLIAEREQEVVTFQPVEYWTVDCLLQGKVPPSFAARLSKIDNKKPPIILGEQAKSIVTELKNLALVVSHIEQKERKRNPAPPFTTSKLQQEAAHKLRFSAKKTMMLAQKLYEGIDLGPEGAVGLITYMRTDSTRLSPDAVQDVRQFISQKYGPALLPKEPVIYRSKKGTVQDAHEAIRPTMLKYDPDKVRSLIKSSSSVKADDADELVKLYQLIWNRFVACQMIPAIYDQTIVEIKAGRYTLRASGQSLKEPGFTLVYDETFEQTTSVQVSIENSEDDAKTQLPPLKEGETLQLLKADPNQHFTQPPPRFGEASLVKELEEKGIGRPSTYAAILSTIQDRGYVEKQESRFVPTELGKRVNELLVKSFPDILNVEFTAQMEENLDKVEEGQEKMKTLLGHFYQPFKKELDKAVIEMKDLKREEVPTEQVCEKCGKPMVIKWGRHGEFLACTGYPECKNTKEFSRGNTGSIVPKEEAKSQEICSECGSAMVMKHGRFGDFLACSNYPTCKHTQPISLGVKCPKPGCDGMIVEKRSKKGAVFYGCTNYAKTKCDFVSWDRPIKEPCPQCGAAFLLKKESRQGTSIHCANCDYTKGEVADKKASS